MKNTFRSDFAWGAATAAYQIEGASKTEGKSPSVWDHFVNWPGKTHQSETGEIACDHYRNQHCGENVSANTRTKPSVPRAWGAAGIANLSKPSPPTLAALRPLAQDAQPLVQATAAEALARHGDLSMAQTVFPELLKITGRPNPSPALWALNALYQLDQEPLTTLVPQIKALAEGKGHEAKAATWVLHRWQHYTDIK